ncbi:cAMP and cAMP-inhibited cGMP 3',5'-cyclic phosphodiesterase 10A-like isoform X2 [Passer domesticus]|uniref:cAMP and cAMP-inhibited cGMP 3',5'-cyclic phosphodiesterase 10A-like isoform X2 n=1 Tax=Passer domesticus TaxID=48849 RepID=UPI0030FE5354
MPSPRHSGGSGGGGGSPGPAIKREGAGGARCGSARRNVPGGAGGRLSRRGSGRLCPAVSRLPRPLPPSLPQESRHRDARLPRAAQRWRGGAAATSCGTGPAGAGGSVEAKNKNWQKLCSVYENVKSVLMTKHRNLENHSPSVVTLYFSSGNTRASHGLSPPA